MKILHTQPKLLLKKIVALEKCGQYEKALAELGFVWQDINNFPETDEFDSKIAADIILRCGSLLGFLGLSEQISNAQERSKDLLEEARRRFSIENNVEKVAECENYLALAYWRTGELEEAEVFINEALSHKLLNSNRTRLYSYIIESKIDFAKNNFNKICQNFARFKIYFLEHGDSFLKANYYNHLGLAEKNLGNTAAGLSNIEKARDYFYKLKHYSYGAACENNISQIYKLQKNFIEAREAIDGAIKTFKKIKDKTKQGFSLETKAQIYFDEGEYSQALETVEEAITILRNGENVKFLVEAYLTKSKILAFADDFISAFMCLSDAVQMAKDKISEDVALELIKDFQTASQKKNQKGSDSIEIFNPKQFQLLLPPELAHHQNIEIIKIQNSHLERTGLKKGSLAVVVNEAVKSGELAAVLETKNGSIKCGFYDSAFGIICLEGADIEPQLFDDKDVKILGKIIGICSPEANSDGKRTVELLKF